MIVPPALAHRLDAGLGPEPGRVVLRLFLPGEDQVTHRSRVGAVVERVMSLTETDVQAEAARLVAGFGTRHHEYEAALHRHASMVGSHLVARVPLTAARALVLGAAFTSEYAVEGAALCNPSAVRHPDQDGLAPGQLRAAVSLRAIGEGHISSIGFASAVIGPGASWSFEPRALPVVAGVNAEAPWPRDHLRAVLSDEGTLNDLSHHVLAELPELVTPADLHRALDDAHPDLAGGPGGRETVELLRRLVVTSYDVGFPSDVDLSQQVLLPTTSDEAHGMEDARFVRFLDSDGSVEYRATYTAYDGGRIAPRLLTSRDLRTFRAQRLAGPAARNKGMALFPRPIDGRQWALCRTDGENTWVASSDDGLRWGDARVVQTPEWPWETLQVGNCGPPLETDRGWLVLTHGVGPMRTYRIGAVLLDLERPTRVVGRLEHPLLSAGTAERDGYVPNVVYSCGGLLHDGRLWLPYGIGDARIGVAYASVDEVLDAMVPGPGRPMLASDPRIRS